MSKQVLKELTHGAAIGKERRISQHVPFTRHITPHIVRTEAGQLACFIKLDGYCFQTADQEDINVRYINRNQLFKALGSSRFIIYSHIIRTRVDVRLEDDFPDPFSKTLEERYSDALFERQTFENNLYLTVMRRPMQGSVGIVDRVLGRLNGSMRGQAVQRESEEDARKELLDHARNIVEEMEPYGARMLGIREEKTEDGTVQVFSEPCEFLVRLLNGGQEEKMRLPRMGLAGYLPTRRLHFGRKSVHFEAPAEEKSRYGAVIGIKEYPSQTLPGLLNGLLQVPCEMIVSQSFSIVDRPTALSRMDTLKRQITLSSEADSIAEDSIDIARDQLISSEAGYGRHFLTVLALSDTFKGLDRSVSEVSARLSDVSITHVREDLNVEPAFWAQLPGNYDYAARDSLISSRNFAGFTSLHNYAVGQKDGNHWGAAISVLQTTSQTPYFFNFHERDLGNFTMVGPSGSGKTVTLSFLMSQARRLTPTPRAIFFDKDRGGEIFIRAIGGQYEVLEPGTPTGFNPLQLENTPTNQAFLRQLFARMLRARDGRRMTTAEDVVIREAVGRILKIEPEARTLREFQTLLSGQAISHDEDLAARLEPWLNEHAWLFDNPTDRLSFGNGVYGFDTTKILDDPEVRTAALMYIFHRIEELLTGDPLMIFMDEGWRLLGDEVFLDFIIDKLKTIRKLNGVIGFGTQSAADIVASKASHTLIEQSACNVFFPNSKADINSYREAFQLSNKELRWIRETDPQTRQFLIKAGRDSVIAKLDLNGMPDLIKVLSGRAETVAELDRLRARVGDDPTVWLPIFCGWTSELEVIREAA